MAKIDRINVDGALYELQDPESYVKPSSGIPKSDLSSGVQGSLNSADTAYQKPSAGIPKTDLDSSVQTSLGKGDTAVQPAALASYVNNGSYNSTSKKIELKHDSTVLAEIDATAFIKDGMVSNVEVTGGYLVITFNTDAGKQPIRIPLTDIFNPDNYYTKTDVDGKLDESDATIPTDVTRTQTDAAFVNSNHTPLFYLRQANSSLAGLMTAAGYTKLNDMPAAQEVNAGVAYDVSVLHPTSGVNGGSTYASLSAALAVIPQDKRMGGMTVKFVHSSDNTYVQYMYIGTAITGTPNPFLNITNWEKINLEEELFEMGENVGVSTLNLNQTQSNLFAARLNVPFKAGDKIELTESGTAVFNDNALSVRYGDESTPLTSLSVGETKRVTVNSNTDHLYFIINTSNITTVGTIVITCEYGRILALKLGQEQLGTDIESLENEIEGVEYSVDSIVQEGAIKTTVEMTSYNTTQMRGKLDARLKSGMTLRLTESGTSTFTGSALVVRYGDATTALTTMSEGEQKSVTLQSDTDGIIFILNKENITTEGTITIACEWGIYLENQEEHADILEVMDAVDAKVTALKTKEEADIEGIYQLYSSSTILSKKKRIGVYIDDIPSVTSYLLTVDCGRTDISTYQIFKCTTGHTGLASVKTAVNFGETVVIERDADKPSLYIYNSNAPDEQFSEDVDYSIVIAKNHATIEGNVTALEQSVKWKGKNIVVFGDSITEFGFQGEGEFVKRRYSDWIAELTGANVINIGIGGTRLCPRAALITVFDSTKSYAVSDRVYYDDGNGIDCYEFTANHSGAWDSADVSVVPYTIFTGYPDVDIYNMVAACCDTSTPIAHRFDNQIAAMDYLYAKHPTDDNRAIVAQLPNINWNTIDAVIIMAGTNDWGNSTIGNADDTTPTTLLGSINAIVNTLLSTYKGIKLYWFTFPVSWQNYTYGQSLPPASDFSDFYQKGGKTERELAAIIKERVIANHIPIGDLYNEIGWNMANFTYYFNAVDGTHPGTGYQYIGRYMVSKINSYRTF